MTSLAAQNQSLEEFQKERDRKEFQRAMEEAKVRAAARSSCFFETFRLIQLSASTVEELKLTKSQIDAVASLESKWKTNKKQIKAKYPNAARDQSEELELGRDLRRNRRVIMDQVAGLFTDTQKKYFAKWIYVFLGLPQYLTETPVSGALKLTLEQKRDICKTANDLTTEFNKESKGKILKVQQEIVGCLTERQKDLFLESFGALIEKRNKRSNVNLTNYLYKYRFGDGTSEMVERINRSGTTDRMFASEYFFRTIEFLDTCDALKYLELTSTQSKELESLFETRRLAEQKIRERFQPLVDSGQLDQRSFDALVDRQFKRKQRRFVHEFEQILVAHQRRLLASWNLEDIGLPRFLTETPASEALRLSKTQKKKIQKISREFSTNLEKLTYTYSRRFIDDTLACLNERQKSIFLEVFKETSELDKVRRTFIQFRQFYPYELSSEKK